MPYLTRRNLSAAAWETHQRFYVEVDWEDDGFSTFDSVNARIVGAVQCIRGRDYASQLTGRTVAGVMRCTLRNEDGLYSSYMTSGPLYTLIRPNLKVRVWSLTPYTAVLWTGFISSLVPVSADQSPTGAPAAQLTAHGIFQRLGDQSNIISPPPQTDVLSSDVVEAILDEAGVSNYDVEPGAVPIAHWFTAESQALNLLQEMADETELGWAHEGLDHDVIAEHRYHRMLESSISQVTFSDDPASDYPYIAISQADSLREIYNRIVIDVTPYSAASLAVLWTYEAGATIYLAPGESVTLTAKYSGEGYVDPWTTVHVFDDITWEDGDLSVNDVVKTATTMTFTLTNSALSVAPTIITHLQARGVAHEPQDTSQVISQDSASQTKFGKRTYSLGSPWYPSTTYAQAAADYFISRHKDPHPVISLTFPGASSSLLAQQAANLALSDRVTVEATSVLTMLGVEQDFFVESIAHEFGTGIPWRTSLLLSPAAVQGGFWVLGVSELDTTTILAF